jgi:hypothetical protein
LNIAEKRITTSAKCGSFIRRSWPTSLGTSTLRFAEPTHPSPYSFDIVSIRFCPLL